MESNCPLCSHELSTMSGIRIDDATKSILLDGKAVKAPRQVRRVLGLLIEKSPHAVTRNFAMDTFYGLHTDKEEPGDDIIPVLICHARKAIKESNYEIETIWGKGWLFRRKVLHEGKHQDQRTVG